MKAAVEDLVAVPVATTGKHARRATRKRRGWVVRRVLLAADLVGLTAALLVTELVAGMTAAPIDRVGRATEYLVFLATLPVWVVAAKVYGLYDRDEERADHSTVDEFVGVFHVVSVGLWLVSVVTWLSGLAEPNVDRLVLFWGFAVLFVSAGRGLGRAWCRRLPSYRQNTVIVGAGDVGQLVARKLRQHPEYGLTLVGLVDAAPKERRDELKDVPVFDATDELPAIVRRHDIERIVIAFSGETDEETLAVIRSLDDADVQIDIVPRLFDVVGPRVSHQMVEGLPILGLPPARMSRSSRLLKRAIDVAGALVGLVLTSPLFLYIAVRIKLDSPGRVFFRQKRVGLNQEEFTLLKFRTMRVGTDDSVHRDYIAATMDARTAPQTNGLYKLDRGDAITPVGRWLRRTSLDELPQLWNILRGEMSLVGPRPCLAYETKHFAPHHFGRFLVSPGLTGLWQVSARGHATFGEALDMDVAYVRGWSLGLDMRLLCKTPLQLLRRKGTA